MKSQYHDATNSWNGYSHQGKAALYTILKMINELKINIKTAKDYEIELEYLEDFTIYKKQKPYSIHQVKTYNTTAASEYKDAVWVLLGKLSMNESIKKAYLHTTVSLKSEEELRDLYKNYTGLPSSSKSENQLSPLDYYNHIKNNDCFDETFKKLKLYTYENSLRFCSLGSMRECIISQLKLYYKDSQSRSDTHIDRLFYFLLNWLDKHINERHIALQSSNPNSKRVPFTLFFSFLNENFEEAGQEYYVYKLKEIFFNTFEQFLHRSYEDNEKMNYQRVAFFLNSIQSLDDEFFLKLCKKWTPHVLAKDINLLTFHELIPKNGINNPLIKSLFLFNEDMREDFSGYLKKNLEGVNMSYLLTTLHDNPTDMYDDNILDSVQVAQIARNIMENSDVEDMHEFDIIISSHISMESLYSAANNITKDIEDETKQESDKFMKVKSIRMLNFNEIKGVFTDD